MFSSDEYLSESEKIDRIYRMLRAERRARTLGWIIKLAILGTLVYGYHYLSMPTHADVRAKITESIQAKISEVIFPMVGNMVQNLTQDMRNRALSDPASRQQGSAPENANQPVITPEMIRAVQDAMKK